MKEKKWICKDCKYRKTNINPYREMCTAYIVGGHWSSCYTKKGAKIVCITFEPKRRKKGGDR